VDYAVNLDAATTVIATSAASIECVIRDWFCFGSVSKSAGGDVRQSTRQRPYRTAACFWPGWLQRKCAGRSLLLGAGQLGRVSQTFTPVSRCFKTSVSPSRSTVADSTGRTATQEHFRRHL